MNDTPGWSLETNHVPQAALLLGNGFLAHLEGAAIQHHPDPLPGLDQRPAAQLFQSKGLAGLEGHGQAGMTQEGAVLKVACRGRTVVDERHPAIRRGQGLAIAQGPGGDQGRAPEGNVIAHVQGPGPLAWATGAYTARAPGFAPRRQKELDLGAGLEAQAWIGGSDPGQRRAAGMPGRRLPLQPGFGVTCQPVEILVLRRGLGHAGQHAQGQARHTDSQGNPPH